MATRDELTFLHFADANGIIWLYSVADESVSEGAVVLQVFYDGAACSGRAYVAPQTPRVALHVARLGFVQALYRPAGMPLRTVDVVSRRNGFTCQVYEQTGARLMAVDDLIPVTKPAVVPPFSPAP